MNRKQKNSQLMGNAVSQTTTNFARVWSDSEVFGQAVDKHNNNMMTIADCEKKQQQAMELKGLVESKNILRILIVTALTRIIAGIRAYANSIGDREMASKVNYQSKLHSMSDTAFLTASRVVIEVANLNDTKILPYGITPQLLTDTDLDVNAFDSILKKPQALRGLTKVFTTDLQKSFSIMTAELRNMMDNMVRAMFPGTEFSAAYFNSRKTYKYNQSPTILRGTITDANGHKVRNAIVELVDYPKPGELTIRHTNARGNFSFKQIELTSATLRVRALGFATAEYTTQVTKNEVTDFDIQLLPETSPVPVTA